MLHESQGRKIMVDKTLLIATIKENRDNHIAEFRKALIGFKKQAEAELTKLLKQAQKGKTNLHFNMTAPINRAEEYDNIMLMFKWELKEQVELSLGEFRQFILDESDFAISARHANSFYTVTNAGPKGPVGKSLMKSNKKKK